MSNFVLERSPKDDQTDFVTECLRADGASNLGDEAPRCPACGRYIGGLPWLPPHNAELELWGKGFGDLAFGSELLVTERFKTLFEQEGLTGLSGFVPVEIVKTNRHKRAQGDPPRYFLTQVGRSRAAVNMEASGLELEPTPAICPECRTGGIIHRTARIILDPSTWSGEDIFIARGLYGVFLTTERFKSFCENHVIKNAVLIPAEQYSFDHYPSEKKTAS